MNCTYMYVLSMNKILFKSKTASAMHILIEIMFFLRATPSHSKRSCDKQNLKTWSYDMAG